MHILGRNFSEAMPDHARQSLIGAIALLIIFLFLDVVGKAAIVAAIGSSAFIIFAMPKAITAQPRNVIGGHIIGLISGSLCFVVFIWWSPMQNLLVIEELRYILAGALSVGLSIFGMASTDTGHPPAGGTALGIVVHGLEGGTVLFVLAAAVALSLAKYLLKPWLKELV